ncbi:MAG: heterodisulfide reductase subunit A [Pseudomonadota bacterium]|nr:MAG: heterodisulfide reductase subunit A [Pseudomonadota bacterium]
MFWLKNPHSRREGFRFSPVFSKLCPPTCGIEINYRRLRSNSHVQIHTNSEVLSVSGEAGNFKVKIRKNPTFVNEKCVACDHCTAVCPSDRLNDFNEGMDKTKAIFLPNKMAYPPRYVVDRPACEPGCSKCVEARKYGAIDLDMKVEEIEVGCFNSIATDGNPMMQETNNMGFSMSRMYKQHHDGTHLFCKRTYQGEIPVPLTKKPVESIAFVQCAGSRDENHLPYCSSICCLGSLKHASYVLEQNPEAKIYIFYIDIRTPGKYEDFVAKVQAKPNVNMIKGKVAKIIAGKDGGVLVEAENILSLEKVRLDVDMVVLATGMEPNLKGQDRIAGIELDENGFVPMELQQQGIFSTGVAKWPADVTVPSRIRLELH